MYLYKKLSKSVSVRLNILRSLAALLVLLMHIKMYYFDSYNNLNPQYKNVANYILFFWTRLGHEAVLIFFVLSGYLVGGNFLIEFIEKRADYKKYFINRLTRMWVVLFPTLILVILVEYLRYWITGNAIFINTKISAFYFFGNLLFLQTIVVPFFGSNSALWSLANEFWYYVFWPVILIVITIKLNWIIKLVISIVLWSFIYFLMPEIAQLFPIWILGALVRIYNVRIKVNWFVDFFSLVITLVFIYIANRYVNLLTKYLLGISFGVLLLIWQNSKEYRIGKYENIATFFSNFSFSLYATHFVIVELILDFLCHHLQLERKSKIASIQNWLIYFLIVLVTVPISYLFYLVTERNTKNVRKYLLNSFPN